MLHLSREKLSEAAPHYQKTVSTVWHEIDDAPIDFQTRARLRNGLAAILDHSRAGYRTAVGRYKTGRTTFLDVIVLQQALLEARARWATADGAFPRLPFVAIRCSEANGKGSRRRMQPGANSARAQSLCNRSRDRSGVWGAGRTAKKQSYRCGFMS